MNRPFRRKVGCKDVDRFVATWTEAEASAGLAQEMENHALSCRPCAEKMQAAAQYRRKLRDAVERIPLVEGRLSLEEKIRQRLRSADGRP
jgi:hypothetical protein